MARRTRLERATLRIGIWYSIQLSYRRIDFVIIPHLRPIVKAFWKKSRKIFAPERTTMEMISTVTDSVEQTEQVAATLARELIERGEGDAFLALYGDLGAGKTAFVRGLASVVAPKDAVCSPTYTVVNEYRSGEVTLCHFDMYRITSEEDLISIGFYDYTDCMIAVEWSENVPYALPEHYYRVTLTKLAAAEGEYDSGKRTILVEEIAP